MAVALARVLRLTCLPLATLEIDIIACDIKRLRQYRQCFHQPTLGLTRVDPFWRNVLLHVRTAAVDVDGQRILWHIRIVKTKALHSAVLAPLSQAFTVFAQAIGEHLCAFR